MRGAAVVWVHQLLRIAAVRQRYLMTLQPFRCDDLTWYYPALPWPGVTRSHEIGRSMMKSEWRQCIDMLFAMNSTQDHGQEEERPDLTRAKVLYKEGNLAEAMNALPASMSAEKQVLKRLQVSRR